MSATSTVKVLLVKSGGGAFRTSARSRGLRCPSVTIVPPAAFIGLTAESIALHDVIVFDLGTGDQVPFDMLEALKRSNEIKDAAIVCVAAGTVPAQSKTGAFLLKNLHIRLVAGDYDLTRPWALRRGREKRNDLVAVLRKLHFRRASEAVCAPDEKHGPELRVTYRHGAAIGGKLVTSSGAFSLGPWAVRFLRLLAGGGVHGDEHIAEELYSASERPGKEEIVNRFKVQTFALNQTLDAAGLPPIEVIHGIGRTWPAAPKIATEYISPI